MRTFVTTDTHGCNKELLATLGKASFDYDNDRLIHLGDCTDRGADSFGVIETLLRVKNLIAIRGNHDDWMREWLRTGQHPAPKYFTETRRSYIENCGEGIDLSLAVPASHRDFFENQLSYFIDDENRCFVHAGYNKDYPITEHTEDTLFWTYDLWTQALCVAKNQKMRDVNGFKRVFIGHQPTTRWSRNSKVVTAPMYAAHIVNCDTGVVYGDGKLSLLDITDDENHILYQTDLM